MDKRTDIGDIPVSIKTALVIFTYVPLAIIAALLFIPTMGCSNKWVRQFIDWGLKA